MAHTDRVLGNEPGYRRLAPNESVKEGDETWDAIGGWHKASNSQIGKNAIQVGAFNVWRRPSMQVAFDMQGAFDGCAPLTNLTHRTKIHGTVCYHLSPDEE